MPLMIANSISCRFFNSSSPSLCNKEMLLRKYLQYIERENSISKQSPLPSSSSAQHDTPSKVFVESKCLKNSFLTGRLRPLAEVGDDMTSDLGLAALKKHHPLFSAPQCTLKGLHFALTCCNGILPVMQIPGICVASVQCKLKNSIRSLH